MSDLRIDILCLLDVPLMAEELRAALALLVDGPKFAGDRRLHELAGLSEHGLARGLRLLERGRLLRRDAEGRLALVRVWEDEDLAELRSPHVHQLRAGRRIVRGPARPKANRRKSDA